MIERLAQGDSHPIISVVAPAGYGKTTLLSQWAEPGGHAVAWFSVDEGDNDPKVLLAGASALTTAELRVLTMMPTHLPARQIAAEMLLSTHTIQSQMKSIHRKLGASTRGQAVTRARELGLLEG